MNHSLNINHKIKHTMQRTMLLLLLSLSTLFASAADLGPAPWDLHVPTVKVTLVPQDRAASFTDPIITYHDVEGGWNNPGTPNQTQVIMMYYEVDHTVNYNCYAQFQILKWQQVGYGFPRQYTWAWVWNTYVIDLPAGHSWAAMGDEFKVGETYDYFNYNVIEPQRKL